MSSITDTNRPAKAALRLPGHDHSGTNARTQVDQQHFIDTTAHPGTLFGQCRPIEVIVEDGRAGGEGLQYPQQVSVVFGERSSGQDDGTKRPRIYRVALRSRSGQALGAKMGKRPGRNSCRAACAWCISWRWGPR